MGKRAPSLTRSDSLRAAWARKTDPALRSRLTRDARLSSITTGVELHRDEFSDEQLARIRAAVAVAT